MNRVVVAILGVMAALVVAVGVMIIVVVAGGDSDDSSSSSNNRATDEPTEEGDGGSLEGELRLLGPEPLTLDPALAQDAGSAQYIVEVFGGLLTLDPELNLAPDLAVEIPTEANGGKTVNPDGTVTYTFQIRDGAQFHDRKAVLADDVKYSLERAADPATQSLVSEFFLGDIVGVKEKLDGQADEIGGVKVIDDATIAITIDQDKPNFLYKLTYPTAFVVDQSQVEEDENWTRRPNGTGPYQLDEWALGERIVLKANPRYHLGPPNVGTVRYLLAGSALTLYESGEIDVTGVGIDDLERIQDPAEPLNAEYKSGERLAVDYIGFNVNTEPFDDPLVREAFALAIDKEQIASAVFHDAIPVANTIVMPGMPAYNEAAPQGAGFNPQRAKQLLAQSRYADEIGDMELILAESGTGASSGPGTAAIVEMWRDNLGIEVQIEQAETSTFFQNVDQGIYQMYIQGWIMDYPDEEDLLNLHFDSESPNNDTQYSNADVDRLLRQALLEGNPQERIRLYQQVEQRILDDVPWIPLFNDRFHVLVKPYVKNYLIPAAIVPRLRFVELEAQ